MVLVAHSYGGAVISNAATGNDQVKALAFLAGWALDEGESIEQLLGLNEGSLVLPALRQVPFTNPDGSEDVDLYLDQEAFPGVLAGDVDPRRHAFMAATQRPWSAARESVRSRRVPSGA
jgi:pimeloyl-ACP methyl ester carboxylesterase